MNHLTIFLLTIKLFLMSGADEFDVFDQLDQQNRSEPIITIPTEHCTHSSVSSEFGITTCLDCGIETQSTASIESKMYTVTDNRSIGDGNRCWAPKKKTRSIRDDLKGLGFPDPIITEADAIFKLVTEGNIYREGKRKSIIVACLMEAYKIQGDKVSLESIIAKLPVSNVTAGMKIVETKIKKYDVDRKRVTYTSPVDSIRDILNKWDSDESTISAVIKLYEMVDNKSSLLNRSRAKSVAAAVLYYYALATKRSNIKLREFSGLVELSESTITKLAKEISAILETPDVLAY